MAEVEWDVQATRSGELTLKLARRHVHSRYEPRRESKRLAEQVLRSVFENRHDSIAIIGSGLGYATREIVAHFKGPVLIWEPFPDLLRELAPHVATTLGEVSANCSASLTTLGTESKARHAGGPLRYATCPTEFDTGLEGLGARPFFWVHPGYEHVCRFEARYALRALRKRIPTLGRLTKRDAIVSERGLNAVARLPFAPVIGELAQCLSGQTAIIAAGGPSLRSALPSLARLPGGVRLACVQRLRVLANAQVHVHFAVSVDLRNLFEVFRLDNSLPFDMLLADTSSAPSMLEAHRDRVCLYHQRTSHVHQLLWQELGLDVIDEPSISVSETAMLLAHRMGARRFVLAGVDLDSDDSRYREQFDARDSRGRLASTNAHYFHASRYLSHFCTLLRDEGCEIFRLGDGLAIEGCRSIELDEFDSILGALPRFTAPTLSTPPDRTRLEASRQLCTQIAQGPWSSTRIARDTVGIERNEPGWISLDANSSRRCARRELRVLEERERAAFAKI